MGPFVGDFLDYLSTPGSPFLVFVDFPGTSATLSGSPARCHASLVPNITSEAREWMDGVDFHILPKKGTKKLEHHIFSAMLNIIYIYILYIYTPFFPT